MKTQEERTLINKLRQLFADYKASEGCGCCRDYKAHEEAEKQIANILKPSKYADGSGYNWSKYKTLKP